MTNAPAHTRVDPAGAEEAGVVIRGRPKGSRTEAVTGSDAPGRYGASFSAVGSTEPLDAYEQRSGAVKVREFEPGADAIGSTQPMPFDSGEKLIDGNVLETDGQFVVCEIRSEGEVRKLRLPIAVMPNGFEYGMGITIGVERSLGVRRFIVKPREMNLTADQDASEQINTLIAEIEANSTE